mgnify:CR=1 FL=1
MNGTQWLKKLPNKPCPERDKLILDAVYSGLAHCEWVPIKSIIPNHEAIFYVCDDAVRVDLEDDSRFRPPTSATLAQCCADLLFASLPTAKVCDLAYKQAALTLPATILPASADMLTIEKSKLFNKLLEEKRKEKNGLIRDCGKAWIISNKLGIYKKVAVNYGFYDPRAIYKNPSGIRLWQNAGTRHDRTHTDYSQTLILMKLECIVDGGNMLVTEVMTHPELHPLISNEGILNYTRQPLW